jgi:uncharacterized protein (DUF302 family)
MMRPFTPLLAQPEFPMSLITKLACQLMLVVGLALPAFAADGVITVPSSSNVKQTIDKLEAALKAGGAAIFARVDHAAGATSAGLTLRPNELLIFGNPKGGTPLMQSQQSAGIDLPMKALAWEDAAGKTWLSYNDPVWIATRHALSPETAKVIEALSAGLKGAAAKATAP